MKKKDIFQWLLLLGIIGTLYFTGLHTEVSGGVQRMFLATGIIKPDIPSPQAQAAFVGNNENSNYKYQLQLVDLEGNLTELSALKGKVVFLNLWASWCPPCIAEMPNIQSLYNKIDKSKIAFVMLSLDENPQKAIKFVNRKKYSFPVYFPADRIPKDLYSSSIPTTFVLDGSGNIVTRHEGMADYDTEEFLNFLKSIR